MSEINVYLKNNEAKECCFFTYNYLEHKIDENLISKYLGVDWDQILKFINTRSDIAFAPTM